MKSRSDQALKKSVRSSSVAMETRLEDSVLINLVASARNVNVQKTGCNRTVTSQSKPSLTSDIDLARAL